MKTAADRRFIRSTLDSLIDVISIRMDEADVKGAYCVDLEQDSPIFRNIIADGSAPMRTVWRQLTAAFELAGYEVSYLKTVEGKVFGRKISWGDTKQHDT